MMMYESPNVFVSLIKKKSKDALGEADGFFFSKSQQRRIFFCQMKKFFEVDIDDTLFRAFYCDTVKGSTITSFIKLHPFFFVRQTLIGPLQKSQKLSQTPHNVIENSIFSSEKKIFKRANNFKFYSLNHLQPPVMMM
jgi:hypothetical protein